MERQDAEQEGASGLSSVGRNALPQRPEICRVSSCREQGSASVWPSDQITHTSVIITQRKSQARLNLGMVLGKPA